MDYDEEERRSMKHQYSGEFGNMGNVSEINSKP